MMKRWLLLIAGLAVLAGCTPKDQAPTGNWLNSPPAAGIVLSIRAPMAGSADTLLPQENAPLITPTSSATPTATSGGTDLSERIFVPLVMAAAAATPTPTPCSWQQGHQPTPPEFAAQLESAFDATFSGTIDSNLYGEWHCGSFGASALDVQATIIVANLNQATLSAADAQFTAMMDGLKPWPAPSLVAMLTLAAPEGTCVWDYQTKTCRTNTPTLTPAVVTNTPTPAVVTNTPTPAVATNTPTLTGTPCAWIGAYRPTPPEFATQLANSFNSTFSGSISSQLYGETHCGDFYAMVLDLRATISVANLNQATLSAADAQFTAMMNSLKPWPAPNLIAKLTFAAPEGTCVWDYQAKTCRTITPTPTP